MAKVEIHKGDKSFSVDAEKGSNLLNILNKNGCKVSSPCGGNGTCGKCKVRVTGLDSVISAEESRLLGQNSIEEGYRLACLIKVDENIEVTLEATDKAARIMTDSNAKSVQLSPLVKKEYVTVEEATLDRSVSDIGRVNLSGRIDSLDILRKLSVVLSSDETAVTLTSSRDRLLDIEPRDTRDKLYGIAVDIGTTTVAAYLVNLNSGETENVYSCLNPQKAYGDDVITRINYTVENAGGLMDLNTAIIGCLNKAVTNLVTNTKINADSIYSMLLTGNTTMLHLAMGLDPKRLSYSPFVPVTTALEEFYAKDLSIKINPQAIISFLPGVSAYVGADTLCAVLGSGMLEDSKSALLVDIGTNGEIALLANDRIYSCSVAAGPAFEGAQLRNGIGGIEGAIDRVVLTNNIDYTTIGNSEPIGICGSGIIDAISQLLEKGLVDETGRMQELDELPADLESSVRAGIKEVDGNMAFNLYGDIYVTQRDIREIQNAKAAVAAGIKTLAKYAGISLYDIHKVYLAGGFGSYIDVKSAIRTGLLPEELSGRVTACGNAAGAGAIMALTSAQCFEQLTAIKEKTCYIELSGNNEFVDFYIESMMF